MPTTDEKGFIHYTHQELMSVPSALEREQRTQGNRRGLWGGSVGALVGGALGSPLGPAGTAAGAVTGAAIGSSPTDQSELE